MVVWFLAPFRVASTKQIETVTKTTKRKHKVEVLCDGFDVEFNHGMHRGVAPMP